MKRLREIRSGEVLRGIMPATIDDPAILEEITEVMKGHGVL